MPAHGKAWVFDDANIIDHSRLNRAMNHQWQDGYNNTDLPFEGCGTTTTGEGDRENWQEPTKIGTVPKDSETGSPRANLHWIMNATMQEPPAQPKTALRVSRQSNYNTL